MTEVTKLRIMMDAAASQTRKKKAGGVVKASRRGLVNQLSFIKALGHGVGSKFEKRATAAAYEEIEHLMDYALASFTYNGSEVLKYTGAETFGLKTAYSAVQSALTGELSKLAMEGGKAAVKTFAESMGAQPPAFPDDPPTPLEAVAA